MTVGTFTTTLAGNEIEFWICQHCFDQKHEDCTGLAWDPDAQELFGCECEGKHPNAEV